MGKCKKNNAAKHKARSSQTFRRKAVYFLQKHGLVTSGEGYKNQDLLKMIMESQNVNDDGAHALLSHLPIHPNRKIISKISRPIDIPKATTQFEIKRQERQEFYASDAWREVRYRALKLHGAKCQCCGASRVDGKVMHVDHIKPRSKFPKLELDINNLQILCEDCNLGKGARDQTDWRTPEPESPQPEEFGRIIWDDKSIIN